VLGRLLRHNGDSARHRVAGTEQSRSCPSGGAHVNFGWRDRRRLATELGEVVPRVAVGRMGWRHPLDATSREGGASWRRETRKEVGSWGCEGRCGVRRGCSSTRQQHAADGASGRAQRRNSGTEAHAAFDSAVRRHARHDARASRRQWKRKADGWAITQYPTAVQNDLNPFARF
jgi:hypothetical protein